MALSDDLPDPVAQQSYERAQLRELEHRLRFPPVLRTAPADKPVVYGYVRSQEAWPAYTAACQDLLTWWCTEEGWHLGTVFADAGVDALELDRAGFAALLDVLMLPDSFGVVLVNPRHLSTERSVAELLAPGYSLYRREAAAHGRGAAAGGGAPTTRASHGVVRVTTGWLVLGTASVVFVIRVTNMLLVRNRERQP